MLHMVFLNFIIIILNKCCPRSFLDDKVCIMFNLEDILDLEFCSKMFASATRSVTWPGGLQPQRYFL